MEEGGVGRSASSSSAGRTRIGVRVFYGTIWDDVGRANFVKNGGRGDFKPSPPRKKLGFTHRNAYRTLLYYNCFIVAQSSSAIRRRMASQVRIIARRFAILGASGLTVLTGHRSRTDPVHFFWVS